MSNQIAMQKRLSEVIDEYNEKVSKIDEAIKEFEQAGEKLKSLSCVSGTWGSSNIDTGRVYNHHLLHHLRTSAWRHVYKGLEIERIASAKDKSRFERDLQQPPEFTMENIRASFGDYLINPRENILRGLAEAFSDLDPAFKSHEKMKIGVKGLPKRVIISSCGAYSYYGKDKVRDILNAIATYQEKPLVIRDEIEDLWKNPKSMLKGKTIIRYDNTEVFVPSRGVRFTKFQNGNGHLFFEPDTLVDINKALSEYYGEVLPDCTEEAKADDLFRPVKREVAKDLQYYPTPKAVVDAVLWNCNIKLGEMVLEPSCGCGRFMDAIKETTKASVFGIEVDANRANEARAKGHTVFTKNFLDVHPTGDYDWVIMNPPFYGKHYAEHVKHALKFLKKGGCLKAVLPITARYDHGLLKGEWQDLPIGSFRESGTNINTTILTIWNR